jgi:hypothetical protein
MEKISARAELQHGLKFRGLGFSVRANGLKKLQKALATKFQLH